jgi:hypothetical protein
VRRYTAVSPQLLARHLIELIGRRHPGHHPLRIALDAPAWVDTAPLVEALCAGLPAAGHPTGVVWARDFYRDASLRFEYGKTDVESFYAGWLDTGALQREVLRPLTAPDGPRYLPALRDPVTNRSARAEPVALPPSGVLLVCGELLLGGELGFDLAIHLAVSRAARKRQVPEQLRWTLPAFDRYDLDADPVGLAEVVVRYDDPGHPALSVR